MRYNFYNREERALCSHLFRLLHEKWSDNITGSALSRLLKVLSTKGLNFKNAEKAVNLSQLRFINVAIFPEVALIRDAYESLKPNPDDFMNGLVNIIKQQEGVSECTLYSELPELLRNPSKTHPKQIRRKATEANVCLNNEDFKVYGALQGMFNAKPDLAITIDDCLLTFEAKFTGKFNTVQLDRTWKITGVWSSLLYKDLGFKKPPAYTVIKLGLAKHKPNLSWQEVLRISEDFYTETDRSLIAFQNALNFDLEANV